MFSYGSMSLVYDTTGLDEIPVLGDIWVSSDPLMFCGERYCQYVFHETSTESIEDPTANPTTISTDRSLNTSAICNSWPVVAGGDGNRTSITIATETGNIDIALPIQAGIDQTTYITNTTVSCGPGCSTVAAFEAAQLASWYYSCNVSVTSVAGATLPEHDIGDSLRRMASSAIALQGYGSLSLVNDTQLQYQVYPAESIFGAPQQGLKESMAMVLSRFAVGVVAITAEANEDVVVRGVVPVAGSSLKVEHWNYIHMILITTASLQLVLGIIAVLVAHQVVVPSSGPIAIGQILRSMAQISHLEKSGASGADSFMSSRTAMRWIYRNRLVSSDGVYDLYMEAQQIAGDDMSLRSMASVEKISSR
jgi:hypothetical protein